MGRAVAFFSECANRRRRRERWSARRSSSSSSRLASSLADGSGARPDRGSSSPMPFMTVTSDEVNYLVYRYMLESGFVHSAFSFGRGAFGCDDATRDRPNM